MIKINSERKKEIDQIFDYFYCFIAINEILKIYRFYDSLF